MQKKVTLEDLNKKLDLVLRQQRTIIGEEKEELKEERKIEQEEREELKELEQLKHLEKEMEKELGPHPLTKITLRDLAKGTIGAFIGVVAHFTFFYGIEVAEWLTLTRATLLYPVSFAVGGIFMYATGFRKIKDSKLISFLPARLIVMYVVSLLVSIFVLGFFSPEFFHSFNLAYKQLATVTLIAIIGACTADLIGKD